MLNKEQRSILKVISEEGNLSQLSESKTFEQNYDYLAEIQAIEGAKPEYGSENPWTYTKITGKGLNLLEM